MASGCITQNWNPCYTNDAVDGKTMIVYNTRHDATEEKDMTGLGQYNEFALNYVAQAKAQQANSTAHESAIVADKAKRNAERLYMVAQAMWELCRDKLGLTDADLEAKVREIDMRDGHLDGRDATQTESRKCGKCGRGILAGQAKCSWCGEVLEGGVFFHAR